MSIEELVRAELQDVADEIEVPRMPSLDVAVDAAGARPPWRLIAAAAVVALLLAGVTQFLVRDRDAAPDPTPRPDETPSVSVAPDRGPVPREPSSGDLVVREGDGGLSVAGRTVPGRWTDLVVQRGTVWVAWHEGGSGQTSLWWGRGAVTHPIDQTTTGVVISPNARWIAWLTRDGPSAHALQVVETRSGEVVASRRAPYAGELVGPVAVTNDGVVVFAHCLRTTTDSAGWPTCSKARLDVWLPGTGVTDTLPLPAAAPVDLARMIVPSGSSGGLVVRENRSTPPKYLRVTRAGVVEVVATLPPRGVAVSGDEQHVLVEGECAGPLCPWEVEPFGGGAGRLMRPPSGWSFLPSTADPVLFSSPLFIRYGPPLFVLLHVVEEDGYVVLDVVSAATQGVRSARCSLSTARCVLVEPPG